MIELNKKHKGILFAILSSSLSIDLIFFKLSLNFINPETINLLQTLFSSLLFIALFVVLRKTSYFKIIIENWKASTIIGLFVFVGGLLLTYGLLYLDPATVAFIMRLTTIFSILFGIIFLKERFTKLEGIGIAISVIGVFIISYQYLKIHILGIILLLLASISFALSNLYSKIYVKNINPVALAGGRSMFIFLFFLIYSSLTGRIEINVPMSTLGYLFLAAITGVFLGFILSYKSLELIEISRYMAINSISPFFTVVYSFLILSLTPTFNQIFGGALIVIGIILLSFTQGKQIQLEKKTTS